MTVSNSDDGVRRYDVLRLIAAWDRMFVQSLSRDIILTNALSLERELVAIELDALAEDQLVYKYATPTLGIVYAISTAGINWLKERESNAAW